MVTVFRAYRTVSHNVMATTTGVFDFVSGRW